MPTIPNVLSFIWVGEAIPSRYADNIVNWARINPNYEVHLWTETAIISTAAHRLVTAYRDMTPEEASEDITMKETATGFLLSIINDRAFNFVIHIDAITTLIPLIDPTILHEELTAWKNYGQASDILRLWVIHQIGGIYMDIDTLSNGRAMPCNIEAPHSLLLCGQEAGSNTIFLNAILASPPNNPLIIKMSENLEVTYQDEYEAAGSGVHKFKQTGQERLSTLHDAREMLGEPEQLSTAERAQAVHFFKKEFICKTTKRGYKTLENVFPKYSIANFSELSFQHQSGYYPLIGHDGSWYK